MNKVVHAPEIDHPGLEWFNVSEPLSLQSLRGRLVILDFWTFCCINCMHVLPTLRRVEEAYPEEVVVIGVHSPKFAAERNSEKLTQAIARYGIAHPVVQDPEMLIWRTYGVRAWPTLVLVSPDGYILGHAPGEPDAEALMNAVSQVLNTSRDENTLTPAILRLQPVAAGGGRLRFPGKLKPLGDAMGGHANAPDGQRWALADSGHHQIIILDDEGQEVRRIGSDEPGFVDGEARTAAFDSPQGLTATLDAVYVADTGNHAVRRIDLTNGGEVATIAGHGTRGPLLKAPVPMADALLASPWDLEIHGDHLYVANAGTHQLGLIDLADGQIGRLAGTGGEDIVDGPAGEALLAQPSGLALDAAGEVLYFADSETSSVRALTLYPEPRVTTLVGTGLFDFGHQNGPFESARFQHALGVAWQPGESVGKAAGAGVAATPSGGGRLLVADSYNGAIRVIDLTDRRVFDLDGGNYTCTDPICIPAAEPAGVIADGSGRAFLVDTNNHRVLEYRATDLTYRTWLE